MQGARLIGLRLTAEAGAAALCVDAARLALAQGARQAAAAARLAHQLGASGRGGRRRALRQRTRVARLAAHDWARAHRAHTGSRPGRPAEQCQRDECGGPKRRARPMHGARGWGSCWCGRSTRGRSYDSARRKLRDPCRRAMADHQRSVAALASGQPRRAGRYIEAGVAEDTPRNGAPRTGRGVGPAQAGLGGRASPRARGPSAGTRNALIYGAPALNAPVPGVLGSLSA